MARLLTPEADAPAAAAPGASPSCAAPTATAAATPGAAHAAQHLARGRCEHRPLVLLLISKPIRAAARAAAQATLATAALRRSAAAAVGHGSKAERRRARACGGSSSRAPSPRAAPARAATPAAAAGLVRGPRPRTRLVLVPPPVRATVGAMTAAAATATTATGSTARRARICQRGPHHRGRGVGIARAASRRPAAPPSPTACLPVPSSFPGAASPGPARRHAPRAAAAPLAARLAATGLKQPLCTAKGRRWTRTSRPSRPSRPSRNISTTGTPPGAPLEPTARLQPSHVPGPCEHVAVCMCCEVRAHLHPCIAHQARGEQRLLLACSEAVASEPGMSGEGRRL
jgi:hypothetical protein